MTSTQMQAFSKVPQATLVFWIVKIAATTLGETAGDAVTMSMDLGYLVGTVIFTALFLAAVSFQIAVERFHAYLFWTVIVATTTMGTTLADFLDRSVGIGYFGGSAILLGLLLATLMLWRWKMGSVSISTISNRRAEAFYWGTVLFSQTLGTALGDWAADDQGLGLGYEMAALIFGCGLLLVACAYFLTKTSRTALFWAAFVLTRPLGATLGDWLDKPIAKGGLALSRYSASAVLVVVVVFCLFLFPPQAEKPVSARSTSGS